MALDSLTRHPERGRGDRAALDALLDEVPIGTLATVATDGRPWAVPLLFARVGDRVLLHGSTGAGALRHVAAGAECVFSVTAMDGLVLAHSTFDHSANYRSAVIRGVPVALAEADKAEAMDALSERLLPGRTREVRPMLRKELAATQGLSLAIEDDNWLLKVRDGGPSETDEEHEAWRGVLPMRTTYGEPIPTADSLDRPVPASVRGLVEQPR